MKKHCMRIFVSLCFLFLLCCAYPSMTVSAAVQPVSLESTNAKIAETTNFSVGYSFGSTQVYINNMSVASWFLTPDTLPAAVREQVGRSAGSGLFLIGGKEQTLPAALGIENGFIVDAAGNFVISEKAMYDTLQSVFARYNIGVVTSGYAFRTSTGRDLVLATGGINPVPVDLATEFAILKDAFINHRNVSRVIYAADASGTLSSVGNTYVEIDVTAQQLYYYVGGQLALSTPVVTGNMARGYNTPQGVFSVYSKARNTILRGRDYQNFVSYWMPFYRGYGMHDATWRSRFGGEIYKTGGSHGCVNMPKDQAAALYGMITVGTPVVIYY